MKPHALLEHQLSLFPVHENEQKQVIDFLEHVNNSYKNYERLIAISEHAFAVTEKEYQTVEKQLRIELAQKDQAVQEILSILQDYEIVTDAKEATTFTLQQSLELLKIKLKERFEYERELRISQERFNLVTEGSFDELWDWDIIHNHVFFSQRFLDLLSHAKERPVRGMELLFQSIHPDDQLNVRKSFEQHLTQKSPFSVIYRLKTAKGDYKTFFAKGQAIWDKDNIPLRMAGSFTDITENLQQQRLLIEMSEFVVIGAWEFKQNDTLVTHTAVTKRLLGLDVSDTLSLESLICMFKEGNSRDQFEQALHTAINEGKDFDIEVELITAKGEHLWIRTKGGAELLNGKVQRVFGMMVDISERKRVELELRYSEEKFRSLFHNISDIITLTDAKGNILFQSASAQQMMHYAENELVGKSFLQLIHPDDLQLVAHSFQQLVQHGGYSQRIEFRLLDKNGEYIYLEAQGNNQLNNPAIEAIVINSREITTRKQNERNLLRKTKLLEVLAGTSTALMAQSSWVESLNEIFPLIGNAAEVDRVYYFECAKHSKTGEPCVNQVIEWASADQLVELYNPVMQDLPFSTIHDFIGKLSQNEPFVEIVRTMPNTATKEILAAQHIQSILVVPVFDKQQFIGFIGFDDCHQERSWTSDEIAVLQLLANSISTVIANKNAEQELMLSNQRYTYVSQATSDIIWELNLADQLVSFWGAGLSKLNNSSANSFSASLEEQFDLIHPDERAQVKQRFYEFLTSKERFWEDEFRFKVSQGNYLYFKNRALAIRDEKDVLMKAVGVMADITEQKTLELENALLLESASLLRADKKLNDRLQMMFQLQSSQFNFVYAEFWLADISNECLMLHTRWSHKERIGFSASRDVRLYKDVITGPVSNAWAKNEFVFYASIEASDLPVKADAIQAGLESFCCIPVATGDSTIGVITFFWEKQEYFSEMSQRFIKEFQKFMGERIRQYQLEEQLNSFFDISPAFLAITKTGRFIRANQLLLKTLGEYEHSIVGKHVLEFIHAEDVDAMKYIIGTIRNEKQEARYRCRIIAKNGEAIWVEAVSLYNADTDSVFTVAIDVSNEMVLENKLLIEKQNRINEVAEAAIMAQEREKEELAKELHDNINQILATSLMYLSLVRIEEAAQKENLQQAISMVKESIREIRQLSHTLSAANLNDHDLHYALLNLFDIMQKSTGINVSHEIRLLLSEHISHKLKLSIYRIIQEQFTNIHKHAKATDVIIELYEHENTINLRIKDNGVGAELKKVESGIGLINIRSRVDLFNGTMKVNAKPGQGFELIASFSMS